MPHPDTSYDGQPPDAGPSTPFVGTSKVIRSQSPNPTNMAGGPQLSSPTILPTPHGQLQRVPSTSTSHCSTSKTRPDPPCRSDEGSRNTNHRNSEAGPSSPIRAATFPTPSNTSSSPSTAAALAPLPAPTKRAARGLSLSIPPGSLAYGGLSPPSASYSTRSEKMRAPPASALEGPASMVDAIPRGSSTANPNGVTSVHLNLSSRSPRSVSGISSSSSSGRGDEQSFPASIPKSASSKKRPARLNLAPSPFTPNFVAQQGKDDSEDEEEEDAFLPAVTDRVSGSGSSSTRLRGLSSSIIPIRQHSLTVEDQTICRGTSPSSAKRIGPEISPIQEREKQYLRSTLTGRPRRRPSMPFSNLRSDRSVSAKQLSQPVGQRLPGPWQDPSEHALTGEGSSLQHARSVYAAGPIEVLPGLFLGDEHNARDDRILADYNITTILDVAKETLTPSSAMCSISANGQKPGGLLRWPQVLPADSTEEPDRSPATISVVQHGDYLTPAAALLPSTSNPFTPSTTRFPDDALLTPLQRSPGVAPPADMLDEEPSHRCSHLLRNTLSTPNLQLDFRLYAGPLSEASKDGSDEMVQKDNPSSNNPSGGTDEDSEARTSSGEANSTSSTASSTTTEVTTPGSSSETGDESRCRVKLAADGDEVQAVVDTRSPIELLEPPAIELPQDALMSTIPPSPLSGRSQAVNYVKLPWTHEQTELASSGGGFAQGCAIIARSLGIDYFGRPLLDASTGEKVRPGNILVHCQCGVSRSATLTIAFVMQSAALNYPFDKTRNLTGMHDCYNFVKDLSSSVSPNISLIYQLVEWERHLSNEAARLRKALCASTEEQLVRSGLVHPTLHGRLSAQGSGSGISTGGSGQSGSGERENSLLEASHQGNQGYANDTMATSDDTRYLPSGAWSSDAMDEEEWTRMRLKEEMKERDEELLLRSSRLLEEREHKADARAEEEAEKRRRADGQKERVEGDDSAGSSGVGTPTVNGLSGVTGVAPGTFETGTSSVLSPPRSVEGRDRAFSGTASGGLSTRRRKQAPSLHLGGGGGGGTAAAAAVAVGGDPPTSTSTSTLLAPESAIGRQRDGPDDADLTIPIPTPVPIPIPIPVLTITASSVPADKTCFLDSRLSEEVEGAGLVEYEQPLPLSLRSPSLNGCFPCGGTPGSSEGRGRSSSEAAEAEAAAGRGSTDEPPSLTRSFRRTRLDDDEDVSSGASLVQGEAGGSTTFPLSSRVHFNSTRPVTTTTTVTSTTKVDPNGSCGGNKNSTSTTSTSTTSTSSTTSNSSNIERKLQHRKTFSSDMDGPHWDALLARIAASAASSSSSTSHSTSTSSTFDSTSTSTFPAAPHPTSTSTSTSLLVDDPYPHPHPHPHSLDASSAFVASADAFSASPPPPIPGPPLDGRVFGGEEG